MSRDIREMQDFCGQRGITSDIDVIRSQNVNEAYGHMPSSDGEYRFVIGRASLQAANE